MGLLVKDLCFSYGTRSILDHVSFQLDYGQFLSVLGPNGVGKSTLFRCILGLLKPNHGDIRIDGTPTSKLNPTQLAQHIAYIPQSQHPSFNYSVFDMVLMGTTAQVHQLQTPGRTQIKRAEAAMETLGISELKQRGFEQISGGEQQLVLIARAIAQNARLLIMDEPSASLDFGNRIRIMQTIRRLTAEGFAVVQSTHDPEQAYQYSDRILALHHGAVLADGPPVEVLTAELISQLYELDVRVHSLENDTIRICIPNNKEGSL